MKNHFNDNSENSSGKARDILPKILSVFAALTLWFYVIDMQTTTDEKVISGIPVVLENFGASEDLSIFSGAEHTIEVTVSGTKSDVAAISQNDIHVTADMNGIEKAGSYKLDINIATPKGITVVNKSASVISVSVDKTTTVNKEIDVVLLYNTDPSVYEVGEPILSTSHIQIQGPEKVVDSVYNLRAQLDCGTLKNAIKAECSIVPVDKSGNAVTSPYLKLSQSVVSVRVPVYKTAVFSVAPVFSDNEYDYEYSVSPDAVTVKGEVSDVNSIKSILTAEIDSVKPGHYVKQLVLPDDITAFSSDGSPINSVNVNILSVTKREDNSDEVPETEEKKENAEEKVDEKSDVKNNENESANDEAKQ